MSYASTLKLKDEQMLILSLIGAAQVDRFIYEGRFIWCVMLQMCCFVVMTIALVSPPGIGGHIGQLLLVAVPMFAIVGLEVLSREAQRLLEDMHWRLNFFSHRLKQSLEHATAVSESPMVV